MATLVDALRAAGGAGRAAAAWIDEALLLEHKVAPWTGLPLWIPAVVRRRGGLHADRLHEGASARGCARGRSRHTIARHRGVARAARQCGRVEGRAHAPTPSARCSLAAKPHDPATPPYLEFAYRTAQRAGAAILPHFRAVDRGRGQAQLHGLRPVTVADHAAEPVIRDAIKRAYPDHGIHGEEHGREAGTSPLTWVIDPIDGTKSFILGQLHWAILIALHDGTAPVVGVAHQPFVGETFLGIAGGWRNGGAGTSGARCARVPCSAHRGRDRGDHRPAPVRDVGGASARCRRSPTAPASCATAATAIATPSSRWASSTSSSRTASRPTTSRR